VTSETEKKQANQGRGDEDVAVAERAEADVKRADPASVLALTSEAASPGESRAGRGRQCSSGGRSAGGCGHRRRGHLRVGAAGVTASSRQDDRPTLECRTKTMSNL
jgi:hypothetical protein